MPISIAILVSGRGSNMQAILEAIKSGRLDARVSCVVSNKAEAPALEIARSYGVQTIVVPSAGLDRREHEQKLLQSLAQYQIDCLVLAGYMKVLTAEFLHAFRHEDGFFKVVNIHPSLLPAFPGAHAYEEAFAAGVTTSGITVHLVDELVDHGPVLAQESFARLNGDTLETFKQRGLAVEHRLLSEVLQKVSSAGFSAALKSWQGQSAVAASAEVK